MQTHEGVRGHIGREYNITYTMSAQVYVNLKTPTRKATTSASPCGRIPAFMQSCAPRIFLTHEISVFAEIPKPTKGGEHARP